jgi:1-acyl-sn-glycerol-3-phosphate acyltransferase
MGNKFYENAYKILSGFLRRFYNIRITGAENEPAEGGFIACSNHLSNHDVLIVAVSLKRQVRFFAKAELFKVPLLKQLITALGAFPVERGKGDVASIKKTISIIENGEVVGFYPQGTRYPGVHPSETTIRNGVGLISYRAKATLLPIAIETKGFKIRPFKRVNVHIGKPLVYDELGFTTGSGAEYEQASKMVFDRILSMFETKALMEKNEDRKS